MKITLVCCGTVTNTVNDKFEFVDLDAEDPSVVGVKTMDIL